MCPSLRVLVPFTGTTLRDRTGANLPSLNTFIRTFRGDTQIIPGLFSPSSDNYWSLQDIL